VQAQDEVFDILTGVEVIDHNFRTFILEGPADGAILRLLEVLFFTLVTGPRRSLSLKLSDTRVYGPQISLDLK